MAQTIARYAVTFGISGCYMPDSHDGAYEFTTCKDLASFIRHELEFYDLPACLRLWRFITRHGSSSAHFSLHHGANALKFHGLTEAEYAEQQGEEC